MMRSSIICTLSSNIRMIKSRRVRWMGHLACMVEMRNAYKILVGKPEGKKPLKKPWHRKEDNIIMDCRKIRLKSVDWIHLAEDRCW
jgi:hypothetical protein